MFQSAEATQNEKEAVYWNFCFMATIHFHCMEKSSMVTCYKSITHDVD